MRIILIIITLFFIQCSNSQYPEELKEYFKILDRAYKESDNETYYMTIDKILDYPDSIIARKGIKYYFFEYSKPLYGFLFYIQADVHQLGFYEDFEVLDRFYKRYMERYDREAVRQDSSLLSVHQAYIQFLSVCNYEKIKPLYLKELSETIRQGDYTYAFNSYLLPEHWTEAADTLMKYYWMVKDEDTKMKMNKAIVKIKKEKGYHFYKKVCYKEPNPVVIKLLMLSIYGKQLRYHNGFLYDELKKYIKDKELRRYFHVQ